LSWRSPSISATSAIGSITTPLPITANFPRANSGRNQVENIFRAAMNNGVTRVVAALAADHDVRLGGQDIDDLSLALIAPLGTDQNCVRHELKEEHKLSRRIRRTHSDSQNDRRRGCGCKNFPEVWRDSGVIPEAAQTGIVTMEDRRPHRRSNASG